MAWITGNALLEGGALAADEDRDVAGRRPVAAAGDRAVDGPGRAASLHQGAQALDLGLVGGAHFGPDLAFREAREDTVLGFHHRGRGRRAGQAGDHHVHRLGQFPGRFRPACALVEEGLRSRAVQVPHRHVKAVAQQAAGQLAADVAQADESDLHEHVPCC